MRHRRWARGAIVAAVAVGIASCGDGGTGKTGTGGSSGGTFVGTAGAPGTGGSGTGTGGSAAGGAGGNGVTGCGTVEPCGGTPIVGTSWTITDECIDLGEYSLVLQQELACASIKVTKIEVSNFASSAQFSGGTTPMGYSLLQNITAAITFNLPRSCIGAASCSDWATVESLDLLTSFTCGDVATGCACEEQFSDSSSDNGTYTVSGTNLVLNSDVTGTSTMVPYCIQGGGTTIHFLTLDTSMHTGPGGQATIFKDVVGQAE